MELLLNSDRFLLHRHTHTHTHTDTHARTRAVKFIFLCPFFYWSSWHCRQKEKLCLPLEWKEEIKFVLTLSPLWLTHYWPSVAHKSCHQLFVEAASSEGTSAVIVITLFCFGEFCIEICMFSQSRTRMALFSHTCIYLLLAVWIIMLSVIQVTCPYIIWLNYDEQVEI
jgi:hypothetical protein